MRIRPRTVFDAWRVDPLLPLLLPECRNIEQARVELSWIRSRFNTNSTEVARAVRARYCHFPLQYILGTQPFGPVEVRCGRKVLIPRWETEEWCVRLGEAVHRSDKKFVTIWDLCTGTGCIPMCLSEMLKSKASITAVDIAPEAIRLAGENCDGRDNIRVLHQDVLKMTPRTFLKTDARIDILTCNPPYIPEKEFGISTAKSVKLFEPHLALVGDKEFYANLLNTWIPHINSFIYEIGDESQYRYVKDGLAHNREWTVGLFTDSNEKPRCVYGYRKKEPHIRQILHDF